MKIEANIGSLSTVFDFNDREKKLPNWIFIEKSNIFSSLTVASNNSNLEAHLASNLCNARPKWKTNNLYRRSSCVCRFQCE